jgi:hypothetical protein
MTSNCARGRGSARVSFPTCAVTAAHRNNKAKLRCNWRWTRECQLASAAVSVLAELTFADAADPEPAFRLVERWIGLAQRDGNRGRELGALCDLHFMRVESGRRAGLAEIEARIAELNDGRFAFCELAFAGSRALAVAIDGDFATAHDLVAGLSMGVGARQRQFDRGRRDRRALRLSRPNRSDDLPLRARLRHRHDAKRGNHVEQPQLPATDYGQPLSAGLILLVVFALGRPSLRECAE